MYKLPPQRDPTSTSDRTRPLRNGIASLASENHRNQGSVQGSRHKYFILGKMSSGQMLYTIKVLEVRKYFILGKMSSGWQKTYSIKKEGVNIKKKAHPYKAVQGVQGYPYKAPYKARRTSESLVRTRIFFNVKSNTTTTYYYCYYYC